MKMKFILSSLILVLPSICVSSLFSRSKYVQKFVDVNSWSVSDSVMGQRYLSDDQNKMINNSQTFSSQGGHIKVTEHFWFFVHYSINKLNFNHYIQQQRQERDETDQHVAVLRRQRGRQTNGQRGRPTRTGQTANTSFIFHIEPNLT